MTTISHTEIMNVKQDESPEMKQKRIEFTIETFKIEVKYWEVKNVDIKLPKTFKSDWLWLLRSGHYEQGSDVLVRTYRNGRNERKYSYCCMGVAAVVACKIGFPLNQEHFFKWIPLGGEKKMKINGEQMNMRQYFTADDVLPFIMEKAQSKMITLPYNHPLRQSQFDALFDKLAMINDAGGTFNQIADLIDEHL
jgi:hypothetical protein